MTRKELLMARANDVVEAALSEDVCLSEAECLIVREVVLAELLRVEREVWGKVTEHLMYGSHLSLASMLSALQPTDVLLAHDVDQRDTIEQARQISSYWKAEHLAGNKKIEEQSQEIAKWKAAHAEMVARNKLLRDRPDLPADRIRAHDEWVEKCRQQSQLIIRLQEALQLLYSVQNGCPLPKYEKDWNRAMVLTQDALKEQ